MKISGTTVLNAPVEQVWAAFNDPAVLARTIPGCHVLHQVGPDAYKMTVTVGVASIKGTYEGDIALTDQDPPGSFALKVVGAGAPGTVGADVLFRLQESGTGGTDLSYEADAVVGGAIGGVGQRMLMGVAKKMATAFFAAVDADIAGIRTPATAPATATAAAPVAAAVRVGVPAGAPADGRPASQGKAFQGRAIQGDGIHSKDFLYGVLTGAAIAIAGVAVGVAAGRR
jgi:carbon monoxide dehydrogenase subunit G